VPTCQMSPDSVGSQKLSKATILQKCNTFAVSDIVQFSLLLHLLVFHTSVVMIITTTACFC